jgi:hypothetical protein
VKYRYWVTIPLTALVCWPFATGDAVILTTPTQLALPCNTTPNDASAKGSYLRGCKEVTKDSIDLMKKQIRLISDKMYQEGKSMDPSAGIALGEMAPGADTSASMHYKFAKPVCTLLPGPLNDFKDEQDSNHIGESCGAAAGIRADTQPGGATAYWDMTGEHGLRELGYYGGAFVQAITCYQSQVENEVNTGKLNISPTCSRVAVAIRDKGDDSMKLLNQLKNELGATKNVADLRDCKTNEWDNSGKATDLDVGQLRQSRQQLCASRENIEKMYAELMVCEVFNRAGIEFRREFVSASTLFQNVQDGPGKACAASCQPQCAVKGQCIKEKKFGFIKRPYFDKGACDGCSTGCGNTCYQRELKNYIRERIKKWDPNDPNSRCRQAV